MLDLSTLCVMEYLFQVITHCGVIELDPRLLASFVNVFLITSLI